MVCTHNVTELDDKGELVCRTCFVVLEEPVPTAYPTLDGPSPSRLLGTSPLLSHRDCRGRRVNGRVWQTLRRAGRQRRDSRCEEALKIVELAAAALNVPPALVKRAETLYHRAVDTRFVRGYKRTEALGAALIYELRQAGVPRSVTEVVDALKCSRAPVVKCLIAYGRMTGVASRPPSVELLVVKGCLNLGFAEPERLEARRIALAFKGLADQGHRPSTLAATALYLAQPSRPQWVYAKEFGCTVVSIRSHKRMAQELYIVA